MPTTPNNRKLKYEYILLILLILFISSANILWILKDNRPQPFFDPYPRKTLKFYDQLKDINFSKFPYLINELSIGPRPPLYQLSAIPFIYTFGRNIDPMLMVNILFGIILIISTYKLGELVSGKNTGLLAALIVSTYPTIVNLTNIFRPHTAAPAITALAIWLLFRLIKKPSISNAWFFGASLSIAFLIHPNFFYILPLPALIIVSYLLFFKDKPNNSCNTKIIPHWFSAKITDPFFYKGLIPAFLITIIPAALWYTLKYETVIRTLSTSETYWENVSYGFTDIKPSFFWYALTMHGAISRFFSIILVLAVVKNIIKPRRNKFLLTITFLLMYLGMAYLRKGTFAWMNFAAVLPITAVIIAIFVVDFWNLAFSLQSFESIFCKNFSSIRKHPALLKKIFKTTSVILIILCSIMSLLNFSIVSWGIPNLSNKQLEFLGSPIGNACGWRMNVVFCKNPPLKEDWRTSEILNVILKNPDCKRKKCSLTIINSSLSSISDAVLSYHLVRDFPNSKMKINAIKQHDDSKISWLKSDYVIYIPNIEKNLYQNEIKKLFENNNPLIEDSFIEIETLDIPRNMTAKIMKRVKNINYTQAINLIKMLNIPDELKNKLVKDLYDQHLQNK